MKKTIRSINEEETTYFLDNYSSVRRGNDWKYAYPECAPNTWFIYTKFKENLLYSFVEEHDFVMKVKEIYFNRNSILSKFKEGDLYG